LSLRHLFPSHLSLSTTANALNETVDVVFPLIHGPNGEDGTIQGLLELADLPYIGANVAASAVGMDKALMKSLFRNAGLPVADYLVVMRHKWEHDPEETIHEVETIIQYPCFVKPANMGSSVGISKARNWDELTQALTTAALYDRKILVERAIEGREIECSVLGNDAPLASLPGEVIPLREFYETNANFLYHTLLVIR
jgi:D-alanine-D-alanine ligase